MKTNELRATVRCCDAEINRLEARCLALRKHRDSLLNDLREYQDERRQLAVRLPRMKNDIAVLCHAVDALLSDYVPDAETTVRESGEDALRSSVKFARAALRQANTP